MTNLQFNHDSKIDAVFTCSLEGRTVGVCYLTERGEVAACLVDPDFRRQGIMTELLLDVVEYAEDYEQLFLKTQPENAAMRRVAESCGFTGREQGQGDVRYRRVMI